MRARQRLGIPAFALAEVMTVLLLGSSCGTGDGGPAEPTASPANTPTAGPSQEWTLDGVRVEGLTVTVTLRVFAGIDVSAVLDGAAPDATAVSGPTLEFVFLEVAPGEHELTVHDVVGFEESRSVTVPPR